MPAAPNESAEERPLRIRLVEMKRLRIELVGETLDVLARNPKGARLENITNPQVFEIKYLSNGAPP